MTSATHTQALHYELVQTRNLRFEVAMHGEGERLALLLHGFPECAHSYRHQIPLFERLGYRVWVPNLRGYGRSDKPRGRGRYTMDELTADVTDLVDASGAKSVVLVGHDWGGAVAWSYATTGPRAIERLIVMNCPHPLAFQRSLLKPEQLRRSTYMLFFQLPWVPERVLLAERSKRLLASFRGWAVHPAAFHDEDLDVYRANAEQPGALTAMLNYYRAIPFSMLRESGRPVRKVRVPTLLVWGEQDPAFRGAVAEESRRYVQDLTIRRIPDASHWVQQDAPEAVNSAVEEWLNERETKGGRAPDPSGPLH